MDCLKHFAQVVVAIFQLMHLQEQTRVDIEQQLQIMPRKDFLKCLRV
jgi:hypothetical protein